jgi:hypothetical protein
VVLEDALARCLAEDGRVPSLPLVCWVVTGTWRWQDSPLRVDVCFSPAGAPPLL